MKTVTTPETKAFEEEISSCARLLVGTRPPLKGPVFVEVLFSLPGDISLWPTAMQDGDIDNHEKSVFDALNGITYTDDRMIVRKFAGMAYEEGCGRIFVRVSPATTLCDLKNLNGPSTWFEPGE